MTLEEFLEKIFELIKSNPKKYGCLLADLAPMLDRKTISKLGYRRGTSGYKPRLSRLHTS